MTIRKPWNHADYDDFDEYVSDERNIANMMADMLEDRDKYKDPDDYLMKQSRLWGRRDEH